jgi:hypothetical protein
MKENEIINVLKDVANVLTLESNNVSGLINSGHLCMEYLLPGGLHDCCSLRVTKSDCSGP